MQRQRTNNSSSQSSSQQQSRKLALSSLAVMVGLLTLFQQQCQSLNRMMTTTSSLPEPKTPSSPPSSSSPTAAGAASVVELVHDDDGNNNKSLLLPTTAAIVSTVRTTGNSNKPPQRRPIIRQISILGERNSGTRWTFSHLSNCFNHSLHVKRHLTRYKHWFQHVNASNYRQRDGTLVIAQFRDPYDWLEAMRDHPHHSPMHLDVGWREFVSKPWTMERIGTDLNNGTRAPSYRCQEDFAYNEIVSCDKMPLPREAYDNIRMSKHQPIYELKQDGSGEPFDSVIDMRAAKIRNFLQTKDYPNVADLWPVQYEYLLAKGTRDMLEMISEKTGVPYQCDPFPIQVRNKRPLSKQFVDYVSKHVDWETEGLIGYPYRRRRLGSREAQEIAAATAANYTASFLLQPNELHGYFIDQEVFNENERQE